MRETLHLLPCLSIIIPKKSYFAEIIQAMRARKSAGYVLPQYVVGMDDSSGNKRLPAI
jgi:hypothetical protein